MKDDQKKKSEFVDLMQSLNQKERAMVTRKINAIKAKRKYQERKELGNHD